MALDTYILERHSYKIMALSFSDTCKVMALGAVFLKDALAKLWYKAQSF